ncbi:N-acetyltransferase [bacterium]|nr:N-acetyltransferase [bacterium]
MHAQNFLFTTGANEYSKPDGNSVKNFSDSSGNAFGGKLADYMKEDGKGDVLMTEYLGNIHYMIESIYKRKANDFRHLNEVFIAYYNDYPIGLISITYLNERQEISIGILEKYRHQYLGSLLTFEFMEKIFELYPDINELYEVVDDKNSNSQKLVQRIGGESTKEKGTFMMRR